MPRTVSLPTADKEVCRRYTELRERLKMSRVDFAAMIGMSNGMLVNRESEISPWTLGEMQDADKAVRKHVAACMAACRDTFGACAFLTSTTTANHNQPIRMKLATPITDRHREQLTELHDFLKEAPAYLKISTGWYHAARRKKEAAEAEIATLRANGGASLENAAQINTLQTQIGLLDADLQKKLAEYRHFHGVVEKSIRTAARWTGLLCQPLLQSYQDELTQALAPFYNTPATAVQAFVAGTDAYAALNRFLSEGTAMEQRGFTTEELVEESCRRAGIVEAILSGGEVFSYKAESLAPA